MTKPRIKILFRGNYYKALLMNDAADPHVFDNNGYGLRYRWPSDAHAKVGGWRVILHVRNRQVDLFNK